MKLLDCTLRDGGYYTNWDFDKDLIKEYFTLINRLPIEYLEIGYRSVEKDEYLGEYFYLPISTIKSIRKYTSKKLAIMLNAKDCIDVDIEKLLFGLKEHISLIRISTNPNEMEVSIGIAKELKSLGFDVALNIMYISKIEENHNFFSFLDSLSDFIKYLYLVDSYGSTYPEQFEIFIKKVKSKTNITLGFHGHNNMELAFANTIKAIENGVEMIDCTILGMGRGAGNLKTELMLTYIKSNFAIDVDLNTLAKITETFQALLDKYRWGTNLAYIVSGSYSLPQKDVMKALAIDRYSLSGIVSHLQNDEDIILEKLKIDKYFKDCIIIGGGKSIPTHIEAIKEYLHLNSDMLIIHSTSKYIQEFKYINNIQYFVVAGNELLKIDSDIGFISKYVLEPSPRNVNITIENTKKFYELSSIEFIDKYFDSPLTLSLQVVLYMNIDNINLIGFDGYRELKSKKELYLMQENQNIIDNFSIKKKLISLTPTKYNNIYKKSIYKMIS